MLVAEPLPSKQFNKWKIWDPNHPGDGNYVAKDTNAVIYLTMDGDWVVQAQFKCGSSEMMPPTVAIGRVRITSSESLNERNNAEISR